MLLLTHFVAATQQSQTLLITSFTVLTFQMRERPFSIKFQVLTDQLLTKTKLILFKLSFMTIELILSQINSECEYNLSLENKRFGGPIFLVKES